MKDRKNLSKQELMVEWTASGFSAEVIKLCSGSRLVECLVGEESEGESMVACDDKIE